MLSVIIPTCNRPAELAECLRRLAPESQMFNAEGYEVIVTDDGRRGPAANRIELEFPWVRYTIGPAFGPAANRNHGASLAAHSWLVFIDDDCWPESNLLSEYLRVATNHDAEQLVALQGPTLRTAEPPSLLWEAPHNPEGDATISANFAITRRGFEAVGRFDERFPSAAIEDTEFFSRFRLSGGKLEFVPQAIVHHPLRRIGNGKTLAKKWEGKVIWALDQGAPPLTITWRLPWHVMRVIQSRFRQKKLSKENLMAAVIFAREWFGVFVATVPWAIRWRRNGRSAFWKAHTDRCGPPPRFGF